MSTSVIKPWGKEIILTNPNLPYTGKILYLRAGQRFSLQYHDQKTETLTLLNGQATLLTGSDKDNLKNVPLALFEGFTIFPNVLHRVEAQTDCVLVEVSTPEIGTTFRLEDDFNRQNETPDIRNLPTRGWQP